jgi:hypothetical protein
MAIKNDVAGDEAAEFAAVLAELEAEQDGTESIEEAAPEADNVEGDPEADEESEDETEEDEGDDEPLEAEDAEALRTEIAELFSAGDIKRACEKLGLDPAIFKINNRQFAAIRKGESEARRHKQEAEAKLSEAGTKTQKAEELHRQAEHVYGPIVAGNRAYKGDAARGVPPDYTRARAAIELMFEDSFENVIANINKGSKPLDPTQVELLQLRKQMADEKAATAAQTAKQAEDAASAKELKGISAALAKTPLADVEGAAEDIQKVVRASYNPALKAYTKTVKEAYAEVKAAYAKKAAQLAKLTGTRTSAPTAAKPGKQTPTRKPLTETRTATPPRKKITEEDEFAASVAEAAKASAKASRQVRRAR